ncbi:MAG: hypothetical protein SNJ74_03555 [Fimbriimonadaceae bacterium]
MGSNPTPGTQEAMRLLITGFGPFGNVEDNPSAWLAERLGPPFRILDVSYGAVDALVEELAADPPDALLLMGVAAGSERMRLETTGRNHVGAVADVEGIVAGPGPIDPFGPPQLGSTLWRAPVFFEENEMWEPSVDAGSYLCNYALYRCLRSLPGAAVGFLHVPLPDQMPLERQLEVGRTIVDSILESDF